MKKPTQADIYRKAARQIESGEADHEDGACCVALRANYEYEVPGFSADDFYYAFMPAKHRCDMWWGRYWPKTERKDCRILALCFMAALVDAGDVPPRPVYS